MKHPKFAIVLAILLLFATLLTSCDKGEKTPADTTGTQKTEAKTEAVTTEKDKKLPIVTNGTAEMTVWVEKELFISETALKTTLNEISNAIAKKTGATLKVLADTTATSADMKKAGILVGNTCFEESRNLPAMRTYDYCVDWSGNKILLYGGSTDGVLNAVKYFRNNVINKLDVKDNSMVFTSANLYESSRTYGIQSIFLGKNEMDSEYRIVIPKDANVNETMLANRLRYYLYSQYGYKYEIGDDTTETAKEILVGNTARTNATATGNSYQVSYANGKLVFYAENAVGYEALTEYITGDLFKTGRSAELKEGFNTVKTPVGKTSDGTILSETKYGNIRIMFYNVYGYGQSGPILQRQKLQTELIKAYSPDVFGIQEGSPNYHTNFFPLVKEIGYTEVSVTSAGNNYTPLFYKADKLEVVESGYLCYAGPNDGKSKGVTWAVFKIKETGKCFVAMTTHFMYDQTGIDAVAARESNANEIVDLIKNTIQANSAYKNLPLIFGGDLNCNESSTAVKILTDAGFYCAQSVAVNRNNTRAYHSYSSYDTDWNYYSSIPAIADGDHSKSIDHAFVTGNTTVNAFYALISPYTLYTSDHMPMIIDITVK